MKIFVIPTELHLHRGYDTRLSWISMLLLVSFSQMELSFESPLFRRSLQIQKKL